MANLGVQLPDLSSLMGGFGGYAMGRQEDMAYGNNKINQDAALQDILFQQKNDPIKLRQAGLNADATAAGLPGITADSQLKTRKVDALPPLDAERNANLSALYSKMSEDEVKQSENAIQQAILSGTIPQEHGTMLLKRFKEFQMEELKNKDRQERDIILEKLRGQNALDLTNRQGELGRWKGKTTEVVSTMDRIYKLKKASEQLAAFIRESTIATQEGHEELAKKFMDLARALEPAAKAENANLIPKAGGVDIQSVAPNVGVNPSPSLLPSDGAPKVPAKTTYPSPQTQAEYDKLPSGTVYTDTDGKVKRKK